MIKSWFLTHFSVHISCNSKDVFSCTYHKQNCHFSPFFWINKRPNLKSTQLVLFLFQLRREPIKWFSDFCHECWYNMRSKLGLIAEFFITIFLSVIIKDINFWIGMNTCVFTSFGAKRSWYGHVIFCLMFRGTNIHHTSFIPLQY